MKEYQIASDAFDKLKHDRAKSSGGIKEVWISGSIVLPKDNRFSFFTSLLNEPTENQKAFAPGATVHFSAIDLLAFAKIKSEHDLKLLLHTMSRPQMYAIALQTHDGHHLENYDNGAQRGNISLTSSSGKSIRKCKKQTVRVRASTMLALRALAEHKIEIAALIAAAAPVAILNEMCQLPIRGNIFSSKALLAILEAMTPTHFFDNRQTSETTLALQSLSNCIHHYLRYPPFSDLRSTAQPSMLSTYPDLSNQDLLLQNPDVFIAEISHLLDTIAAMPHHEDHAAANDTQARKAGWQAASLVSNAFTYIIDSAQRLSIDQGQIIAIAERTAEGRRRGDESTAGSADFAAMATPAVAAKKPSTRRDFADRAARVAPQFDLTVLTAELATLSDTLKTLSSLGLPAPTLPTVTKDKEHLLEKDSNLQRIYQTAGNAFLNAYEKHLAEFFTKQPADEFGF